MDQTLDARLFEAGLADRGVSLGATIRPKGASFADTLAAVAASLPTQRTLPRLSVDLRASVGDGREPGAAARSDLEVVGVLGEGGMGRVFLARQHSLVREVAVKTVKDADDERARESLLAEGAVTGQLEHPAIVPVHALGLDEAGKPALVMKRIEGVSWSELCEDPSHPGWEGWDGDERDRLPGHLQILVTVCNAAHFAHSRGIVHRDIKPENVLIGRFGDVYLADWGIAGRVGESGARLCGTPVYMAPEMVLGHTIDARTDVYLLGATLHEMLAGAPRHRGDNALTVLHVALLSEPYEYGDGVPRELAAIANRACHADPEARFQSAQDLRDALSSYLRHRDSVALGDEALARSTELRALLAKDELDDDDRRAVDRLGAEARFGLEQALARWSDNAAARSALDELEALLEARRARAAALEREARERDPRVDALPRAVALTLMSVLAVAISGVALSRTELPDQWLLIAYPSVVLSVTVVAVILGRGRVLTTKLSRQLAAMVIGALGMIVIGRVLGLFVPIGVAEHFVRDCFVLAAVTMVGALAYLRWIGWLAVLYVVAGIVIAVRPAHALPIFGATTTLSVVAGAAFAWATRVRSAPDGREE